MEELVERRSPNFFLTKVWGYDPVTWPILGFGTLGGVNKLCREYTTGDWIVFAGTQSEPTAEEDRGRLLGMVQVTNVVVDVELVLKSLNTEIESVAYKDDGTFRWPKGFPYLKALSFVDKPLLNDLLPDRDTGGGRAEAAYAIRLSAEHKAIILSLRSQEVSFPTSPLLEGNLRLQQLLTQPGPPPAIGNRQSEYVDGDNSVYVFRIKGTNFYKIGRTNDIQRRLNEFNNSPHAIWAEKPLTVICSQTFQSAISAHEVEQMIHIKLVEFSVGFECYKIPRESTAIAALGNTVFEYSQNN